MTTRVVSADTVRRYLLETCGYPTELLQANYEFGQAQRVDLAAFAHRPLDARSACVAAIDCWSDDPRAEVVGKRELGAPVVFACLPQTVQVWKPGPRGAQCVESGLSARQLPQFFRTHRAELAPRRIYDAKTIGRLPGSGVQPGQFVDAGLLPFAEGEIGGRLTDAVVEMVGLLEQSFAQPLSPKRQAWTFKATFRLLAAKVLKDKEVSDFRALSFRNLNDVFRRVQQHYGSSEEVDLGRPEQIQGLAAAAAVIGSFGNLRNLTTEALSDVYECALIDKDLRTFSGTHGTPSYLVDYMVWRLAPWLEESGPEGLFVFEPACGHAPFLVGMMRLLRNFAWGMTPGELSAFFRDRFMGIDIDPFALEIARLSLTVADVPNPNGWSGLVRGDMFQGHRLRKRAERCSVLLANPPYEKNRPLTMLRRTIPALQPGAMFGVVLPSTLLFTDKPEATAFRAWLAENCQLAEISLFPDHLFRFADQECAVLLGRRLERSSVPETSVRCRRVREEGREAFKQDYAFTTDRSLPQLRVAEQPRHVLWVPEWDREIWSWLKDYPQLQSIAVLNQGLRYKNRANLPAGTPTLASKPFPGSVPGFASSHGQWQIHAHPPVMHFSLQPEALHRLGSGAPSKKPQIVLNYRPAGRGLWRLKPFIDEHAHAVKGNFITLRLTTGSLPIEYLWAICCSPLANAYVYTHTLKRDILILNLGELPIPPANAAGVRRVVRAARAYLDAARADRPSLFAPGAGEEQLHRLLRQMDAEVLRLYDLPARAEHMLLRLFDKEVRPGVPGQFKGYYPARFRKNVPLYAFLSDAYQRALAGQPAVMPAQQLARYDALIEKQTTSRLTAKEEDELYALQAEVDGRDYATQEPSHAWLDAIEAEQLKTQKKLGALAEKLIGLTRTGKAPDDRPSRA